MSNKFLWGVIIVLGLVATTLGVDLKLKDTDLRKAKQESVTANLELGRAETRVGDANKYVKDLDKVLQDEVHRYNSVVDLYASLKAKYDANGGGRVEVVEGPVRHIPIPVDLNLTPGHLYVATADDKLEDYGPMMQSPYHDSRLDALVQLDAPEPDYEPGFAMEYQLHLKFTGSFFETTDKDGVKRHYFFLNEVDEAGKKIGEMQLTHFTVTVNDERAEHLIWFAPHADAGIVAGWNGDMQLGGSIGVSLAGYGLSENDLSWRFVRVGLNLGKDVGIDFSPVQWNAGRPLPLVSNLWLAPYLSWDKKLGAGLMLSLVM